MAALIANFHSGRASYVSTEINANLPVTHTFYGAADNKAAVHVANYFDAIYGALRSGDMLQYDKIQARCSDGLTEMEVATVSPHITVNVIY